MVSSMRKRRLRGRREWHPDSASKQNSPPGPRRGEKGAEGDPRMVWGAPEDGRGVPGPLGKNELHKAAPCWASCPHL